MCNSVTIRTSGILRTILSVCILLLSARNVQGQGTDYTVYHKGIITAEEAIFLKNDSIGGLAKFKSVFQEFPFAYVDDCIEAFQLALHFKRENYAMAFIRKALENGFELQLLDSLSPGCPCDFYKDIKLRVTVYNPFLNKNKAALEAYAATCYPAYIAHINRKIAGTLLRRHIREQLFKDGHPGLSENQAEQQKEYVQICDDNLRFIDSLGAAGVFPGEQNTGMFTARQVHGLGLPCATIEDCVKSTIRAFGLPENTYVPAHSERDYFDKGPVYNMLFHNPKSYATLCRYSAVAIKAGLLHPREYASLKYNARYSRQAAKELMLEPFVGKPDNVTEINKKRAALLLPGVDLDYNKHLKTHEWGLQLFFGMFNGTR